MNQAERIATSDNPPRANDTPRSVGNPLIVLFVAAAFLASGWFFYHQGLRDAASGDAAPAAISDATTPPSDSMAQQANTNGDSTLPAASADSAQPAAGDVAKPSATEAAPADTAAPAQPASTTAKAKPAAKRALVHTAKPSSIANAKPDTREAALLQRPNPVYPRQALRDREQGTVIVLAQVDVHGRVTDARVTQRSGWYALDRAATNEVRRWQFQPALRNGQPVVASVQVPVSYRLDQE